MQEDVAVNRDEVGMHQKINLELIALRYAEVMRECGKQESKHLFELMQKLFTQDCIKNSYDGVVTHSLTELYAYMLRLKKKWGNFEIQMENPCVSIEQNLVTIKYRIITNDKVLIAFKYLYCGANGHIIKIEEVVSKDKSQHKPPHSH